MESTVEALFDDERNIDPDLYWRLVNVPLGGSLRFTIETEGAKPAKASAIYTLYEPARVLRKRCGDHIASLQRDKSVAIGSYLHLLAAFRLCKHSMRILHGSWKLCLQLVQA